jgi:hypothetical protein
MTFLRPFSKCTTILPDEKLRIKWRGAIKKEFHNMTKCGVWRKMKCRDVPSGQQCIKNCWVFEIKRNRIFRSILVAGGYSQIPGVDLTESYAPVTSDVTWRIQIVAKMSWNLEANIVDVETACHLGDLDEEIYMEAQEGLELDRMVFVSVQFGFDDSLLIGNDAAIEQTIEDLKAHCFGLKVKGELDNYLNCQIAISNNNKTGWIHQPHLIKKIEKKFGPLVKSLQSCKTPRTPGRSMLMNPDTKINVHNKKIYYIFCLCVSIFRTRKMRS